MPATFLIRGANTRRGRPEYWWELLDEGGRLIDVGSRRFPSEDRCRSVVELVQSVGTGAAVLSAGEEPRRLEP